MDESGTLVTSLTHSSMIIRLALATVIGSLVGLERALLDKPAGIRTNILICVGACIFTIASQVLSGPVVDHSRIAAQIVTGVGFLGAGAIIRDAKSVIGLTTAATIWAVAAVGMAAGFGEYFLAISGTACIMGVLVALPLIADFIETRRDLQVYRLMTLKRRNCLAEIENRFNAAHLRIIVSDCYEQSDQVVFTIRALGPRAAHRSFREEMIFDDDWRLCPS